MPMPRSLFVVERVDLNHTKRSVLRAGSGIHFLVQKEPRR